MGERKGRGQACCWTWALIFFIIGAVLIIVGIIVLKKFLPDIIHDQVLKEKVIGLNEDGSDNYITRTWKTPQYLTYMQYWIYNYTNVLEIQHSGAKPDMLEKGPYSYREKQKNIVEGWSEDRTKVYYRQNSVYTFDEATSCPTCRPDDVFVVPDVIFFKMMNLITSPKEIQDLVCSLPEILPGFSFCNMVSNLTQIQQFIDSYADILAIALKGREAGPFIPVTVNQLLFDGYNDPIFTRVVDYVLELAREVLPEITNDPTILDSIPTSIPTPKANLNFNNNTIRVQYTMRTGKDDIYKVGEVLSFFDSDNGTNTDGNLLPDTWWNNENETQCPAEQAILARRLNGTMGEFFKPFVEKDDKLYLYVPDICRSLYLVYQRDETIKGIDGMQFIIPPEVFDYDFEYNCGFCTHLQKDIHNKKAGDMCFPTGLLDITQCTPCCLPISPIVSKSVRSRVDKPRLRANTSAFHFMITPPIAVSNPHFLNAAKEVQEMFPRLTADDEQHQTAMIIEPNMGLVLKADKRLQINVIAPRFNVTRTYNVYLPGVYPVLWINESFLIDSGTVDDLNSKLFKPKKLAEILSYALGIGLGSLCIVISAILALCGFIIYKQNQNKVFQTDDAWKSTESDRTLKVPSTENSSLRRRIIRSKEERTASTEDERILSTEEERAANAGEEGTSTTEERSAQSTGEEIVPNTEEEASTNS